MNATIIDIDKFKENVPGYQPRLANKFHKQSAILADRAFKKELKSSQHPKVILMCGGSASGKTEYVHSILREKNIIVYDSTL